MSDATAPRSAPAPRRSGLVTLTWIVVPLALLAAAFWWIATANPLSGLNNGAPPVEALSFERTILDETGIKLEVRAGGSEAMTIAQVQVDDAYWAFTQEPAGQLARGQAAWIHIPYPWVIGEAHVVKAVTNTGTTFDHEIAVAVATPVPDGNALWSQAIIGAFVGLLPVAIGLMFYPALRNVGRGGMDFLLALTIGMLAYLLVDMSEDALELAAESAALFQGPALVILAAAGSFLVLMAVGRRRGQPTGLALATFIALGIGLHNLGEGLAIGAAFAAGSAGLGTFLVIGFALHNVTEGIGVASPLLKEKVPLWAFGALTLIAGGPAVIGMWIGSIAASPQWTALFLGIGAGAILQVIVEVGAFLLGRHPDRKTTWLSAPVLAGVIVGLLVMYGTAAIVKL
jgi:ZIP family zinc transporter